MEKSKKKKKKDFWKKFCAYFMLALMVLSIGTMAISVLAS